MPFLLKQIICEIVEQNSTTLSAVSDIKTEIGYGGIYFSVNNLIVILQNFDNVITSEPYPVITYYGLKNEEFTELTISY